MFHKQPLYTGQGKCFSYCFTSFLQQTCKINLIVFYPKPRVKVKGHTWLLSREEDKLLIQVMHVVKDKETSGTPNPDHSYPESLIS